MTRRYSLRSFHAVVLTLMFAFPAIAKEAVLPELAPLLTKFKSETGLPTGTAVVVIADGRIVHQSYAGYADIGKKQAVQRDTVFYIASATKPFFALNALLQQHRGKLSTHSSLQSLYPKTQFNGFDASQVQVRDLLVHTSGIDNQPLVWATAFSGIHDPSSLRALVAASSAAKDASVGQFAYSNVGYNVLSVWLDDALHKPWQAQLNQTIFQPLGMRHTSAYISAAQANGWQLAKPYSSLMPDPQVPLYLQKSDATMQAAGGMLASAPDLGRFLIMQMANGAIDGVQRLPKSVIQASQIQQVKTDEAYEDFKRDGYAWGWYTGAYKGQEMRHHFGSFAGFHAHMSFMPEAKLGLVVLNNEDFLSGKLTSLIADYVYGSLLREADTAARITARANALIEKANTLPKAVAKQYAEINARRWQLSLSKANYAGDYTHPQLGTMKLTLASPESLTAQWGALQAKLTAIELPDQARVEFAPGSGMVISFKVNGGKVESLEFNGMHFDKQ